MGISKDKQAGITRRAFGGIAAAGGIVAASPAWAARSDLERDIDTVLATFDKPDAPGLGVAVARDGQLIYERSIGFADLDHRAPIRADTIFHTASISKQFTAFAIALLERDGKLRVEDDVRRYLPDLPDFGATITLSHLIHHTSGLRDQWNLFALGGMDMRNLLEQGQVRNMMRRQRGLDFAPGANCSYCNTAYTLLADVVTAVSGKSFRAFLQERIFGPLGMTRTFVCDDAAEIVRGRAQSYEPRKGVAGWKLSRLNYENWGASSLLSRPGDLVRWVENFRTPKVGDKALIARVTTPGKRADGTQLVFAHGLVIGERAGRPVIFHTGSDAGFRAQLVYFPEDALTVAILANCAPTHLAPFADRIADVVLRPPAARMGDRVMPLPGPPPFSIEKLQGVFIAPAVELLNFDVTADGPTLKRFDKATQKVIFREDGTFDVGRPDAVSWRATAGPSGQIDVIERLPKNGERPIFYKRAILVPPKLAELEQLAGEYRSEELDCTYSLTVEEGKLVARSIWISAPIPLHPTLPDRYESGSSSLSVLEFDRGRDGAVKGFQIRSIRLVGVRFDRVANSMTKAK